jgi:hypothetical protein
MGLSFGKLQKGITEFISRMRTAFIAITNIAKSNKHYNNRSAFNKVWIYEKRLLNTGDNWKGMIIKNQSGSKSMKSF